MDLTEIRFISQTERILTFNLNYKFSVFRQIETIQN